MVSIHDLKNKDIHAVAKMHELCLKEGILAHFGERFLIDFYKVLINQNNTFTLVAKENRKVVGFSTGAVYLHAIPKIFILKLWHKSLILLIRKPKLFWKALQMIQYPSFKEKSDYGEIFSLAVKPEKRSQGIGKKLIQESKSRFKKLKCEYFQLSVKEQMLDANEFYKKIGLKKSKSAYFLGNKINFWIKKC